MTKQKYQQQNKLPQRHLPKAGTKTNVCKKTGKQIYTRAEFYNRIWAITEVFGECQNSHKSADTVAEVGFLERINKNFPVTWKRDLSLDVFGLCLVLLRPLIFNTPSA